MIAIDHGTVWDEYKKALDYQQKMGLATQWPEFTRFIEGKQWPPATDRTKYMPRPVINQCDFIIENKLSNVLSQTLKMVFSPAEMPEDGIADDLIKAGEDFTDSASTTWDDIDQDALNEEFVNDILSLGTGVFHYLFDNSIKGGQFTPYVGKLQGEVIDPMDVFLGNPQLPASKTQKQPWIIIRSRRDTKELQEIAKKNKKKWDLIIPDKANTTDSKYEAAREEVDGTNQTTLLTKYYKENGQVMWIQVTENTEISDPVPLTPAGSAKPFELYPIEIGVFKRRRKCTFGRSIIEDIIPNQKALNWGLGMMLLSVQQTAWPKVIAKVGALLQSITNEPGEILTDHNAAPGIDGIKYMQPPNFSQMPIVLSEKLLEMTRQVTGTTEVSAGEVMGANMAAAAIIALQNQAKKPNEAYQNKLFRSIKNVGRIYEEFYKCHYNMPRPIDGKDDKGNPITKKFIGSGHADKAFNLKIDVGPASVFSESLQVAVLDKMHEKGDLDKYQYVKYLPNNIVSGELKHDFEKEYEMIQQQQQQQASAMQALTPEEQAELHANPQLMQQAMASVGGVQNGMQNVPKSA